MSIKLNGSSAGSVSFDAPADTSPTGTDVTLTLPTSAGSAGQYLRNSGTAGTLEFAPGGIIQVAQAVSDTEYSTTSTTFVNTSLITLNFSNAIQSGSKVLASIDLSFGEINSSDWGKPHYFTLFEGTSGATGSNIADASKGMGGANAVANASSGAGGYNNYDIARFSAKLLHTPSSTNPYYRLFVRTFASSRTLHIGSAGESSADLDVGRTTVTIMEVAL